MRITTDKCHWCLLGISRTYDKLSWVDEFYVTDCLYHPITYVDIEIDNSRNGLSGVHQTTAEVHAIIKEDYLRKEALRKHAPFRSVDTNVVSQPKNPRRTTRMAAEKVLPKTGSIRREIYELIRISSGMTDAELEAELRMKHQTISASRRSLVLDGFIIDSGRVAKNAQGNECIVWVATSIDGKLFT